jgi:hypothetical protein
MTRRTIRSFALIAGSTIALAGASVTGAPCEPVIEALGTGTSGPVYAMISVNRGEGRQLYIGGQFETVDGEVMNNISMWDGSGWNAYRFLPLNPPNIGIPGSAMVTALQAVPSPFDPSSPDEHIAVAGDLQFGSSSHAVRIFPPMEVSLTGTPVSDFDSEVTGFGISDLAYGEVAGENKLFMGGAFHEIDGEPILRLGQRTLAWDDTWSPVVESDGFIGASVIALEAVEDDAFGAGLYFSGSFARLGWDGPLFNSIARWDGTEFHQLGTGLIDEIINQPTQASAMAFGDIGGGPMLFVGGSMVEAGGVQVNSIAGWDGSVWHALGSGITTSGFARPINALVIFDDGNGPALYAGGAFDTAGGEPASNLARWDGEDWEAVGTGTNGRIRKMTVHDDGSGPALYIAGEFTQLNGVTVNNIARLRSCDAAACPADVTGDGVVDLADLNLVLANFGMDTDEGDANGDGTVDLADLNLVLAQFGGSC